MLGLLVALLYLYLSAGIRMFSTWREARRNSAAVVSLQREHEALVHAHASLARRATVEAQARKLGMVRPGEQPYIISGLPGN
jgi:cell division protein FtsB